MTVSPQFDAIVVGSGITGGWAAKQLTEAGLKVLMIERGRMIRHQQDYTTETSAPWEMPYRGAGDAELQKADYSVQSTLSHFNEWNQSYWVNDRENPYQQGKDTNFSWIRGYHLGGRSLMWGRQSYRWGDLDFGANKRDGHGVDWPVRYADMAPWYDLVEEFIGVSGSSEGLDQLPDGKFQPPMALNKVEQYFKQKMEARYPTRRLTIGRTANLTVAKGDRANCQYRSICSRGCSYGAYFSTQSSTLPAAEATGNLTLVTDQLVERIDYDPRTKRATGVSVLDTKSRTRRQYTARTVFLCAGAFNSVALMLRSTSDSFPLGFANSSGILGKYIMDHAIALGAVARIPGFDNHTTFGNRPTGIIIPRFCNATETNGEVLRGYSYQGGALQTNWPRAGKTAGIGAEFKEKMHSPGEWRFILSSFAETLPRKDNNITLDAVKIDALGAPQIRIEYSYGPNERKLLEVAALEARKMVALAGGELLMSSSEPSAGGASIHEMGGARMGHDPRESVLDGFNRTHDVDNVFVTDGAAMASTACQNPSLTYMAFTARAADHAIGLMRRGVI